jgi:WD40 repeat protein
VWNVDTQKLEAEFQGAIDNIASLSFDAESRWLAAASDEGRLTLWDMETRESRTLFPVSNASSLSAFFAQYRRMLFAGATGFGD